jgi:hypothetical protein
MRKDRLNADFARGQCARQSRAFDEETVQESFKRRVA